MPIQSKRRLKGTELMLENLMVIYHIVDNYPSVTSNNYLSNNNNNSNGMNNNNILKGIFEISQSCKLRTTRAIIFFGVHDNIRAKIDIGVIMAMIY